MPGFNAFANKIQTGHKFGFLFLIVFLCNWPFLHCIVSFLENINFKYDYWSVFNTTSFFFLLGLISN